MKKTEIIVKCCREKVEKILSGLKWSQFPGLHSLLLKGSFIFPLTGTRDKNEKYLKKQDMNEIDNLKLFNSDD